MKMDCQDALDLLYDIIDKEASDIDTKEVKTHLENCKDCFEKYRLEESVQNLLNEKLKTVNENVAPTENLQRMKMNVLGKLDEIDEEVGFKAKSSIFSFSNRILVAAAALVLFIGAGFLASDFVKHYSNYISLEKAHWQAVADFSVYNNEDLTNQTLAVYKSDYNYALSQEVLDLKLVGSKKEDVMGVEFDHLVYSNDGQVVSVFIAPKDLVIIPSDLEDSKVVKDQIAFFDHHCRGCRLVYHTLGEMVIVTATTDRSIELLDFVPGHTTI